MLLTIALKDNPMPLISMFYGVLVYMYAFDDKRHHLPHVHVEYAEDAAVISLADGEVVEGSIPKPKLRLVQAWMEIHRDELMADWKLAVNGQPIIRIRPLE